MDNKDSHTDKELERVIELMDEGRQLSDEELAELLGSPEAMDCCREMELCKNAIGRRCLDDVPDAEVEWEQFRQKKREIPLAPPTRRKSYRFLWGTVTGIAATLLIVLLYTWMRETVAPQESYIAFVATDSLQNVMLQTGSERITLGADTRDEELAATGTTLYSNKDTLELAYHHASAKGEALEEVKMHRLSTPRGKDFKLTLEDGTVVWMNAESQLEYPSRFAGAERRVILHGEAYFQVSKDASRPFIVITEKMQARVLGTELNVRSYTEQDAHITLIEGSVEIGGTQQSKGFTRLQPGEDAQWMANGSFQIKEANVDDYIYWRDGYFYFDDTPLVNIMQTLGRWYNINVVFESKEAMDLRLRYFCVRGETLERAVELLNRMKKIKAAVNGNTVIIK